MSELRHLRYFVAVAEAGQITQAASRLGIAQPTLSQSLAQLEDRLGMQLLERRPHGVHLTDAGRVLLEHARATVKAADETLETASALGRSHSQRLAVGFHTVPLARWAQMFQRLLAEYPGARLEWRPLGFPRAGRPLEGVDVALLVEPTPHPDLSVLVLEREPRVVVMAAGHPLAGRRELTVEEVLDETFPGPDPSLDPRWQAFWTLDEERGGPARVTGDRVCTTEGGVEAVAAGRAIGTATASHAAAMTHPGVVTVPLVDARPATLALVWRTANSNPLVAALVAIATDLAGGDGAGQVDRRH
jgi:DNA-binding transcriptional LysR family regulator